MECWIGTWADDFDGPTVWVDGPMDGPMVGPMVVWMDVWMGQWMARWAIGWVDGPMFGWVDGPKYGWVDGKQLVHWLGRWGGRWAVGRVEGHWMGLGGHVHWFAFLLDFLIIMSLKYPPVIFMTQSNTLCILAYICVMV